MSFLLLLISSIASFMSINRLVDSSKLVSDSNTISLNLEGIISNVKDAETAYRGYVIKQDSSFLDPYYGAYDRAKRNYDKVRELTASNPVQQRYLTELLPLISKRFKIIEQGLSQTTDRKSIDRTVVSGTKIMERLRDIIGSMKAEEERRLAVQNETLSGYVQITPILVIGAAILSMLITGFAFIRIRADLLKREALQNQLEENTALMTQRLAIISEVANKVSEGDYKVRVSEKDKGELGGLAEALNQMASDLQTNFDKMQDQAWLQKGFIAMNDLLRGEKSPGQLAQDVLTESVHYLQGNVGIFYLIDENSGMLLPSASYAFPLEESKKLAIGEGQVGQVAKDKAPMVLNQVPETLFRIESGLLDGTPATVIIFPLIYDNVVLGVLEIGTIGQVSEMVMEYLHWGGQNVAIALNTAKNRLRVQELLQETQAQSEELQVQQEELERSNAELEMQSQKLQASEEELRVQQEELMQSNQELEEKAQLLEEKNQFIEQKSRELINLYRDIEVKNKELEKASRYKSEFLANMSHELRTPLNSILLLAKLLWESKELDLGDDRYEYAKVIHGSGMGLLELINEILDLSKIEAGQMQITIEDVPFQEISTDLAQMFKPLAQDKNLELKLDFSPSLPPFIQSDKQRLEQILKNLLSNAIKFTENGTVSLEVMPTSASAVKLTNKQLHQGPVIAFVVKDTGIGIPLEKQDLVFEAFKQVDGSSRRKYGGTGLGLSISREISRLLGGEIQLESESGKGSTFTVYLPLYYTTSEKEDAEKQKTVPESAEKVSLVLNPSAATGMPEEKNAMVSEEKTPTLPEAAEQNEVSDDRHTLTPSDKAILIVEDDISFVKALIPFVKANGYKVLVATSGDQGLLLARKHQPAGILLDINLPVMDGWSVIEHLKNNAGSRHIPVHMMSSEEARQKSLLHGAIDFINKPMAERDLDLILEKMESVGNKSSRLLLIVEENKKHADALANYFNQNQIDTKIALTKEDGLLHLHNEAFDGVILDITDNEQVAFEMLDQIKQKKQFEKLPIIVYTGNTINAADVSRINSYAATSIVKKANTYEKLLNEVSIFLHLVDTQKSPELREKSRLKLLDRGLAGKTILIADDDERNVYSLTKVLEAQDARVISAINGLKALEQLQNHPEVDAVLIDIMMPTMDGYETIHAIRQQPQYKTMPVIAVTAKTMPADRSKCIAAGASDYISKPVDIDQLLSLLKVWLY